MNLRVARVVDIGERLFVVLLAIPFLAAFAKALPTHPNLIVIAMSESLAVFFILTRRGGQLAVAPIPVLAALLGTALPLLVRPGGYQLAPQLVGSSLMLVGFSVSVLSKLYLNRSFGLVAANRGVKVGGPYRFVRHPMYLGYFTAQVGFLLSSFTLFNLLMYVTAWCFQLRRVSEEEAVLARDAAYRAFASRVRSRVIPGLY